MRTRIPKAISMCARCNRTLRALHFPDEWLRSKSAGNQQEVRATIRLAVWRKAATGSRSPRNLLYGVTGGIMRFYLLAHEVRVVIRAAGSIPVRELGKRAKWTRARHAAGGIHAGLEFRGDD